jgi:hypothetical protein
MDSGSCPGTQGLTLVHFPPQLMRFLWDRVRVEGLFRVGLGVAYGFQGVCGDASVYFVSETAQVELKSGRV